MQYGLWGLLSQRKRNEKTIRSLAASFLAHPTFPSSLHHFLCKFVGPHAGGASLFGFLLLHSDTLFRSLSFLITPCRVTLAFRFRGDRDILGFFMFGNGSMEKGSRSC